MLGLDHLNFFCTIIILEDLQTFIFIKNYRDSFFLLCIQMFLMVTFFKLILHPAQSDNMTKEKFAENFLANDISARKISFRDLKG